MKSISFFHVMSKRDQKPINAYLQKQFGVSLDRQFVYVLSNKSNLYMATPMLNALPLEHMRITTIGLYLGEWSHGELRLSIEGSQLFGPHATQNVFDLTNDELSLWMRGERLAKDAECVGYVIVRHNVDYLGCGRLKNGALLNFIPKTRRLQETISE